MTGVYRDTVERRVSDVPVAGHPLMLRVRVPRYRCAYDGCDREVFCHDSRVARATMQAGVDVCCDTPGC